jgi:PleD family two-component response regulator
LPASNKQATTLKAGPAEASVSPPATNISPTELANPIAAIDGQAIQILVVDDEPINQQVLKNHLSGKGYYLTQH